jgi:hypothetical protein
MAIFERARTSGETEHNLDLKLSCSASPTGVKETGDTTRVMASISPVVTLSARDYDAVLFDLDGVLTKTAEVHMAAWKRMFDGFLAQRAAATGEAFVAFHPDADYRRYVDGKLREDGVASFL